MAQKASTDGAVPRRTVSSDLHLLVGLLAEIVQEAVCQDAYELEEFVPTGEP